ncbi:hypothetical protein PNP59_10610 [Halobacterium salinarum]|nr:hypothetical protein [Halobacterium salinarum]MBB6090091.1 hypothetical protein [Halobacterium salinarum]MDL0131380.1 hypothetical protein [Halobacterium salinarum]
MAVTVSPLEQALKQCSPSPSASTAQIDDEPILLLTKIYTNARPIPVDMTDRPPRIALVILALCLLTVPFWAPLLDVTGTAHEYSATQLTVEDDRVQVQQDSPRLKQINGLDCFRERSPTRTCGFESALLTERSRSASYPGVRHVDGDPSLAARDRYLAFPGDGRVFERVTDWNESAQSYRLSVERVNASQAVADVSHPVDQYSPAVQRAVETGASQSQTDLREAVVVNASGRYYAVYTSGTTSLLSEAPGSERVLEFLAVITGAVLLFRAGAMGNEPASGDGD